MVGLFRALVLVLALGATPASLAGKPAPAVSPRPPKMDGFLKESVLKKVSEDREVVSRASLDDWKEPVPLPWKTPAGEGALKRYSIYAGMQIRARLGQAWKTLTDYPRYAKMIPYVDKVEVVTSTAEKTRIKVQGGIWGFRLSSVADVWERADHNWIHYEVVSGHFQGMQGDLLFAPVGAGETRVLLRGETFGKRWPPTFVVERGAEIVFGFAGRRMRSYIEAQKLVAPNTPGGRPDAEEIPQPRSHL